MNAIEFFRKGRKVQTRAGEQTEGNFIRLKKEAFWRRVNSDGTLTRVPYSEVQRAKNNNIQKSRDNTSILDWRILPLATIKRRQNLILRNTEGVGNVLADGISILTNQLGDNTYYDGKLHNNTGHLSMYQNKVKDDNRNIINLYTDKNDLGFEPSNIGPGRYSDIKKFGELPAYKGKFYGDTIYAPLRARKLFLENVGKSYNIYKDSFAYNSSFKDNTDDVRHHYITFENNNSSPTVLMEDIWDSTKWLNELNYPFILNQRVPVIFTNDQSKLNQWPDLSNWFLNPQNTYEPK